MFRIALPALTFFCFQSTVDASVATPKCFERASGLRLPRALLSKPIPPDLTDVPPPAEARVTSDTEVTLDGKPCAYKDVPATATVVRMVLAADGMTICQIEFVRGK